MSGLFTKKYVEQQEFQEGEVPDDHSDQPVTNYNTLIEPSQPLKIQPKVDKNKQQPEEDQFIFETVPDDLFEGDFKSRDKPNYKSQDYYPQQHYKKQWDKYYEKEKPVQKVSSQKSSQKKESQSFQSKKKSQVTPEEPQIKNIPMPMLPPQSMGYYSNVPPIPSPYLPPGYYPPYGPQQGVRHPYVMYPPPIHHQPPTSMYVAPPPQGPYQIPNPHMYQIPPPITYGTVPMVPQVPDIYRIQHSKMMQNRQASQQQIKPYGYQQPLMPQRVQPQSPYNQPPKFNTPSQRQPQLRQRQDPRQAFEYRQKSKEDHRYGQQRQRSRDRKEIHEYENGRQQKKQKYSQTKTYQSKGNYDQPYKDKKQNPFSSSQTQKKAIRDQKKSELQLQRGKLKNEVNENLKILFGAKNDEKEEFLFVLRDVLKFRLLKRQEQELSRYNNFKIAKPVPIYVHSKQVIESNHEKALLKLENFIITLAQQQKVSNSELSVTKRESLFKILSSLQLDDLITKIKQMRLKKKLIGERKMSEIKRLLEELVKDPRKRIK